MFRTKLRQFTVLLLCNDSSEFSCQSDSTMSTITPNITATLSKTESPVITVGSVETNGKH